MGAGDVEARLLAWCRAQTLPLWLVLDAAQGDPAREALFGSGRRYRSLYNGEAAEAFRAVAPYLVRAPATSRFVEAAVTRGWANHWGVWALADVPFAALRRHLRRFVKVELPGEGAALFRFYDPRVLAVYLSSAAPGDVARFFGPVRVFVGRDRATGAAWVMRHAQGRVSVEVL